MKNRQWIASAFIALVVIGTAACAPDPPPAVPDPPPIEVGDCFTNVGIGLSFQYDGPADTFNDVALHPGSDCTGPVGAGSTVVFASDGTVAAAKCSAANPGYTLTSQLSTEGWVVVSGSGTPGAVINDQVWGCGPPV